MALFACAMAMAMSAASTDYGWLLACRVALGAGVAVSGPVVASLVGDYFQQGERGRVYGWVLAGEGACTGLGLLVSGQLAGVNWRLGFWWLARVGLVLAIAVGSLLREPLRGGGSPVNQRPAPRRSVWRDVCYMLSIRTNIVLVVAEAVRTTLVSISTGLAPIVFGLMSTSLGLQDTFLVLLGTLVVGAALILCVARRTFPDVATAMACEAFSAPLPATPAGYPSACPT